MSLFSTVFRNISLSSDQYSFEKRLRNLCKTERTLRSWLLEHFFFFPILQNACCQKTRIDIVPLFSCGQPVKRNRSRSTTIFTHGTQRYLLPRIRSVRVREDEKQEVFLKVICTRQSDTRACIRVYFARAETISLHTRVLRNNNKKGS